MAGEVKNYDLYTCQASRISTARTSANDSGTPLARPFGTFLEEVDHEPYQPARR